MKAISFLSIIMMCCSITGHAKNSRKPNQCRLFTTSAEFKEKTVKEDNIKQIHPRLPVSKNIVVDYNDGTQKEIPKSNVWGYRDRNGHNYRVYEGMDYEIKKVSTVIVYKAGKNDYFSKGLNAPVYDLTRKNLKKMLGEPEYNRLKAEIKKWEKEDFK